MRQITLPAVMFDTLEGRLYQGNFAHEFGQAPITLGDVMLHREDERPAYDAPPAHFSTEGVIAIFALAGFTALMYATIFYVLLS